MNTVPKLASVRPPIPRAKIYGILAILVSAALAALFCYAVYFLKLDIYNFEDGSLQAMHSATYYALAVPIGLVTLFVIGTGFWIGWTILTIKVVPPMPEIVDKKDHSKFKAFLLCLFTMALAGLLLYGLYLRNFWALAIPATAISLVVLGAVFWVGIAIITTRSTLPEHKKES
ncbi:MAG: hypothetical protein JXA20_10415 [Spirochaetes bacterium]|nr:hypothetical protein [Spirochaetota bacterium]